jgi:hypothetical protein
MNKIMLFEYKRSNVRIDSHSRSAITNSLLETFGDRFSFAKASESSYEGCRIGNVTFLKIHTKTKPSQERLISRVDLLTVGSLLGVKSVGDFVSLFLFVTCDYGYNEKRCEPILLTDQTRAQYNVDLDFVRSGCSAVEFWWQIYGGKLMASEVREREVKVSLIKMFVGDYKQLPFSAMR